MSGAGVEGVWVTGTRTFGGAEAVTTSDLWHLGSCTKSMTATLIALLVERGDLDWDKTLPQLLPEFAKSMNPAYADVTLVDLLAHRAGDEAAKGADGAAALLLKTWIERRKAAEPSASNSAHQRGRPVGA